MKNRLFKLGTIACLLIQTAFADDSWQECVGTVGGEELVYEVVQGEEFEIPMVVIIPPGDKRINSMAVTAKWQYDKLTYNGPTNGVEEWYPEYKPIPNTTSGILYYQLDPLDNFFVKIQPEDLLTEGIHRVHPLKLKVPNDAPIGAEYTVNYHVSGLSNGSTIERPTTVKIVAVTPTIGFEAKQLGSTLSWSVEEEIGVKKYVIKDDSGKIITTVIADGSSSYHVELPEGITDVVIEVVDNDGSSQTYAPEDGNRQVTFYDLEKGWNLIAITADNADLTELENVASGAIWAWNEESYTSVESAEATNAVWVYMNSAKQVKIIGEKSDATINLSSGWNLVGPVENIHIPEKVLSTYSWNSISEMYQNITKDSILQEGVGYWLFSF